MLHQKDLINDFALVIAHYLNDNANIKDFCTTQFDKQVTIYVGELLRKSIPTIDNAPYIVISELAKKEGTANVTSYSCTCFVGVSVPEAPIVAEIENILMYDGCDVLSAFMNLIQVELNKRKDYSRPIDTVNTSILGFMDPKGTHCVGVMNLKWEMEQVLNLSYDEEF